MRLSAKATKKPADDAENNATFTTTNMSSSPYNFGDVSLKLGALNMMINRLETVILEQCLSVSSPLSDHDAA